MLAGVLLRPFHLNVVCVDIWTIIMIAQHLSVFIYTKPTNDTDITPSLFLYPFPFLSKNLQAVIRQFVIVVYVHHIWCLYQAEASLLRPISPPMLLLKVIYPD